MEPVDAVAQWCGYVLAVPVVIQVWLHYAKRRVEVIVDINSSLLAASQSSGLHGGADSSIVGFIMESTSDGAERHPHGEVRTDVVDGRILVMTVDRIEKKNAFTPKITAELGDALTRLDEDPELFVGVLAFAGDHTTAGLEMPLFFGADADGPGAGVDGSTTVDPFGLRRRRSKPLVTAVQGITFTVGIEIALA